MRTLSAILLVCLAACSSSDYDRPDDRPAPRGERGMRPAAFGPMLLDLVPDDAWWRDTALVEPLHLTSDQFQALDRIANDQRDEIARLQQDLPVAVRDLRTAVDADPASANDINAAAQRIRSLRDSLFDRQTQMLTAERLVLTKQQWSRLTDELRERREQRMDRGMDRGGYGGRGRGGYPRGGRGRPWPY